MAILPYQQIKRLARAYISSNQKLQEPGANDLDLTVGSGLAYRLHGDFALEPGQTVENFLRTNPIVIDEPFELDRPRKIRPGDHILLPLAESFRELPQGIEVLFDARSTIARLDTEVKTITDSVPGYDHLPQRKSPTTARLYALVRPRSFALIVKPGLSLNKAFFSEGPAETIPRWEVQALHRSEGLVYRDSRKLKDAELEELLSASEGLPGITLRLALDRDVIGFAARRPVEEAIDPTLKSHYDPLRFFRVIRSESLRFLKEREKTSLKSGSLLRIEEGRFYIFSSKESVCVPNQLAGRMVVHTPHDTLRVQYSGGFDSGWGVRDKKPGNVTAFEIRSPSRRYVRDGMPIAKFTWQRLAEKTERPYETTSNTSRFVGHKILTLPSCFKPIEIEN